MVGILRETVHAEMGRGGGWEVVDDAAEAFF